MQLDDLVPSVERIRAKGHRVRVGGALGLFGGRDLVTADGVAREQVAAVLVQCRGMVRTRKESAREIGPYRVAQMFRGEPPPPVVEDLRHMEVILGAQPPAACSACTAGGTGSVQPGVVVCSECSGTGRVAPGESDAALIMGVGGLVVSAVVDAVGIACHVCRGQRFVPCSTCDGTGQTIQALVGSVKDTPVAFSHVYIPSLASAALESNLEEALASGSPPECFRVAPSRAGSDFAGFAYGDRMDLAQKAIDRTFGDGQLLAGWLHCFAWPLLLLKSDAGGPEAIVFFDSTGKLRTLVQS